MSDQLIGFAIVNGSLLDISAIMRLEKECFADDAWSILDITYVLSAPHGIRFKAVVGDEFAGFAAAEIRHRERSGWISTIAVMPRFRNLGIGSALLAACEAQTGYPRSCLSVNINNQTAISLYLKAGYRKIDVWKDYYQNGDDAIIMEKIL